MKVFRTALVAMTLMAGPAMAAEIVGTWQRDSGESRVRFTPCGAGFCGVVTWLKDPATASSKVGQRVFYDMKPDGEGWTGNAFNPEDGKTYTGKATVSGGSMTTKGCVFGGLICKSVSWSRVN
jgi:uncharacterized protein (DUF2147 family)